MADNFTPPSVRESNVANRILVDAIKEALLNLESFEGEMKSVKRRLQSHLAVQEDAD